MFLGEEAVGVADAQSESYPRGVFSRRPLETGRKLSPPLSPPDQGMDVAL